jgi:uncharacterized protein YukE
MNVPIPESTGGLATFVAGAVGIAYSLSKVVTSWRGDAATGSSYKAMQATVEGLAAEIERLSKQNKALADRLNQYQLRIIELNDEIIKLRETENSKCAKCGADVMQTFREAEARMAKALAESEAEVNKEIAQERKLKILASSDKEDVKEELQEAGAKALESLAELPDILKD